MSVSISEFSPKSGFEIRISDSESGFSGRNSENLHGCSGRAALPSDSRVRHMRLTVSGAAPEVLLASPNPSLSGFGIQKGQLQERLYRGRQVAKRWHQRADPRDALL